MRLSTAPAATATAATLSPVPATAAATIAATVAATTEEHKQTQGCFPASYGLNEHNKIPQSKFSAGFLVEVTGLEATTFK